MKNIIITTTDSIESATIEKYLGVVTTNLVIGTNFFSDFTASFSDLFGGMSGTYRRQMDSLYERAKEAISMKASSLGANCILGFKIDFDEISGKGKSMFMVSVYGTAVKLSNADEARQGIAFHGISSDELNTEIFKYQWKTRDERVAPTEDEWDYILSHNLTELLEPLYDYYIKACIEPTVYADDLIFSNFTKLLSGASYEDAVKVIYKDYPNRSDHAFKLIQNNNLLAPQKVNELIQDGYANLATDLLKAEKAEYTRDDIKHMKETMSLLDHLPYKGKIEEVKSGILSSKLVEMYICPNGHKNNKDNIYCSDCGLNIKGLTMEQVDEIEKFKIKVAILDELLNNKQ